MWRKDWHQYGHGRILAQDRAAYMLFVYSSARVGEYRESNMRRGSGRGLLYEVSGVILQGTVDQESCRASRLGCERTIDFAVRKKRKGRGGDWGTSHERRKRLFADATQKVALLFKALELWLGAILADCSDVILGHSLAGMRIWGRSLRTQGYVCWQSP